MTKMTLKPKLDEPGMNTSATTHKLKEELTRLGCRGAKKRQKEKEKPLSTALSKPPKPENAGLDTDSRTQTRTPGTELGSEETGWRKDYKPVWDPGISKRVSLNQDHGD